MSAVAELFIVEGYGAFLRSVFVHGLKRPDNTNQTNNNNKKLIRR